MDDEVNAWIQNHDDDPMVISVSNPESHASRLLGQKKTRYLVRASSRAALTSVSRSYKDFAALYEELVSRFKGSIIPPCPPEKLFGAQSDEYITKRMHLLESFLQAIVDNPFLRNDNAFSLFLNSTEEKKFHKALIEYKESHKNQVSEGMKWWSKALEASVEPSDPDRVLKQVDKELDDVLKSLKLVKDVCKVHVGITLKFAESYSALGKAVHQWERKEVDTVQVLRGILPRMDGTKAILAHELRTMSTGLQAMSSVIQLEYGAGQIELIVLDAVRYEIIQAERWKLQIAEAMNKMKLASQKAEQVKQIQTQLGTLTSKPGHQEKAVAQLMDKLNEAKAVAKDAQLEAQNYQRGILVVELTRYRKQRTMRVENMTALLGRFHLRGANMIKCAWDGSAASGESFAMGSGFSSLTDMSPQNLERRRIEGGSDLGSQSPSTAATTATSGGSSLTQFLKNPFAKKKEKFPQGVNLNEEALQKEADTLAEKRTVAIERDEHRVQLHVLKQYVAGKKDELDLAESETVTAVRVDDDWWYATNESNKSGLVPSSHVRLAASVTVTPLSRPPSMSPVSPTAYMPAPPPPPSLPPASSLSQPPPPPGAPPPPGLRLSMQIPSTPPPPPSQPPATRAPLSSYESVENDSGQVSSKPWYRNSDDGVLYDIQEVNRRSERILSTSLPKPPQLPEFMVKNQTEFDTNLPRLPKNAEAMEQLKAKLLASIG
ncbi:hypothetical protein BASA81_004786 [Batrachochytrium salamandrivorans]|nr:hypothetical protein BASA81_004786 [Batrachochytrium salamandrivorans]